MNNSTRVALKNAVQHPYDSDYENTALPGPPINGEPWGHLAARAVVADLLDRREIKWALDKLRRDDGPEAFGVRLELVNSLSEIIMEAHNIAVRHFMREVTGREMPEWPEAKQ